MSSVYYLLHIGNIIKIWYKPNEYLTLFNKYIVYYIFDSCIFQEMVNVVQGKHFLPDYLLH